MSLNRVIGSDSRLPWHLSEDLKHFKKLTSNSTVIMGRKTFQSIGRPLPNRQNIVLSLSSFDCPPGVSCHNTIYKAMAAAENEIFIIGGAEIYKLFLPLVDNIYLTSVLVTLPGDTFFPEFNSSLFDEEILFTKEKDINNDYPMIFKLLKNKKSI